MRGEGVSSLLTVVERFQGMTLDFLLLGNHGN